MYIYIYIYISAIGFHQEIPNEMKWNAKKEMFMNRTVHKQMRQKRES